jgi:hypothetical protein
MAKGLRVPVGVNRTGGTSMVEGDEQKRQVIVIALSSGENANAFQQDVNLGQAMIFGKDGPGLRAAVMQRLLQIFESFEREKLFRLMQETIAWSKGDDGELVIEFQYIDIESDETKSFRKQYSIGA